MPTGLPWGLRGSRICSRPDSAMFLLEELVLPGAHVREKAVQITDDGNLRRRLAVVVAIESGAERLQSALPLHPRRLRELRHALAILLRARLLEGFSRLHDLHQEAGREVRCVAGFPQVPTALRKQICGPAHRIAKDAVGVVDLDHL